jgi:hypothetical protein
MHSSFNPMKTNLTKVGAILVLAVILMSLSSCSVAPQQAYARGGPPPGYGQQMNMIHPQHQPMLVADGSPSDQRLQAAQAYMSITGTEKLNPVDANVDVYRSIIAGGRFRRDADGIISQPVLQVIASGGVIGWSGSSFGFEPTVREVTGVTEKLSVNDVAQACVKYRKLPNPQSQSGRLVRARAIQIEQGRGHIMQ